MEITRCPLRSQLGNGGALSYLRAMKASGELSSILHPTGVRTITFGHPAHNSFPAGQLTATVAAIDAAGDDEDTRCILLDLLRRCQL